MKAIFPCSYFYPETAASLYITDNIVYACANNDIEVFLCTPTPTRNVAEGSVWKRKEILCDGKIHIRRFHLYGEGKNPIARAFRYVLCDLIELFYCLVIDYDVAFIDSTPPIQGLKMPIIKFFRHKKIVYNAQDLFPDSLVGTGLTHEGSLLWKIGRIVERITYKYSDKIIVISEDFKKNLLSKGVPESKIEVVYNWVDQDTVIVIPRSDNKLFDKYKLDPSKFYVTYCGNIGLTQNMDMLMEVAKALEVNTDIHFVLVGNGAYKDELEKIIKERNIGNVTMIPFQPYEDISHVFSLGDVGIIISKPGVGANSVPSKTWSIMSASRPVLANFDENEIKTILEDNKCGIFTKAGDKVAFTDAIIHLYQHPELCQEYGKNGRKFVMENLTKEIGTQKYVDVIKSVVKEKTL